MQTFYVAAFVLKFNMFHMPTCFKMACCKSCNMIFVYCGVLCMIACAFGENGQETSQQSSLTKGLTSTRHASLQGCVFVALLKSSSFFFETILKSSIRKKMADNPNKNLS